jgi:hypothetical protein
MELMFDATETDDPSLVGEAAHMIAEQDDGPRGDPTLPVDRRNKYANLILLCNVHHKQVDDQASFFTVDKLKAIKDEHERWVRQSLSGYDQAKQADDERWASYIEEWATRANLDGWQEETCSLLQAEPYVSKEFFAGINSLREWLLSRVWPPRYPALRAALLSFRSVAEDFSNVFRRHSKRHGDGDDLWTEKFYRIDEWNPELYDLLLKRFNYHVDLVHDLTYELTRAANYVCDQTRECLDRTFRIEPGVLLVRRGMDTSMMEYTYRSEYRGDERTEHPYPGLNEFLHVRASRDVNQGTGDDPTSGRQP